MVTSTELLQSLIVVQTLSNVGRLLLNGNEDIAGLVVEALLGVVVTNVLDGISDDLLVVEVGLGGDLTEDHDHTGLGGSLTGYLGEGVLFEASIEDSIGYLIAAYNGLAVCLENNSSGRLEVRHIWMRVQRRAGLQIPRHE